MDDEEGQTTVQIQTKIVQLRDAGASWRDIQEKFGVTRQQARYAYQLGKRAQRRRSTGTGST